MSRDLKKCYVSNNGETYSWDNTIKKWVQVTITEIQTKAVPEDVIEEFCKDSYRENNEEGGCLTGSRKI